MGSFKYFIVALLAFVPFSAHAATVIGQAKFTSYSTHRQAEIAALQSRPASSGTNTGDVTIGTANGLSLSGQALSLQAATDSVPGALTAADHATFSAKQNALTADVDYLTPSGSAADLTSFPILNQNTTGSAAKLTTARTINGTPFDGTTDIQTSVSGSSDYTAGTWVPTITAATVGDLSVSYAGQIGRYTKIGNRVIATFSITATPIWTTAASYLKILGLPLTSATVAGSQDNGALSFAGINKVGYTQIIARLDSNSNFLYLECSGMGQTALGVVIMADLTSGNVLRLRGTIVYQIP